MKKAIIGASLGLIVGVVAAAAVWFFMFYANPSPSGERTVSGDSELKTEQDTMERIISSAYSQNSYSFDNPLVILDPFGAAPLTALAKFETEEPVQISVTVEGKEEEGDITKVFSGFSTSHEIPILGLYPDYENTVIIEAENRDGDTGEQILSLATEPLPDDFLITEVIESEPEMMEPGLTFIIPSSDYAYAVDYNGEVRWYSTLPNSHVFKRLDNGNLLHLTKKTDKYNLLLEMNMLGQVFHAYEVNLSDYEGWGIIHHDAVELENGNILATAHDESEYVEDEMIEIDRETGELVDQFNFRDIMPEDFYEDYIGPGVDEGDWFHQNAVWYDEEEGDLLISSRHQSLIMEMTYPEGEIQWILADHEGWPEEYEQYLLEPVGEDFKFPGGPHSVMTLPDFDDNDATKDIMIFDNNIAVTRGDESVSEEYSRGVQYRINTEEMTAEEIWSYGEERGESFFSKIVSDANYLEETGNRLLAAGYTFAEDESLRSIVVEVTGEEEEEIVYELKITGFEEDSHRQVYRAVRMPLYPEDWDFSITAE